MSRDIALSSGNNRKKRNVNNARHKTAPSVLSPPYNSTYLKIIYNMHCSSSMRDLFWGLAAVPKSGVMWNIHNAVVGTRWSDNKPLSGGRRLLEAVFFSFCIYILQARFCSYIIHARRPAGPFVRVRTLCCAFPRNKLPMRPSHLWIYMGLLDIFLLLE